MFGGNFHYLNDSFFQFAASILIPITLALLLSTMLLPLQRVLTRLNIPVSISAALIALALTSGIIVAGYALAGPAQSWLERVPASFHKLERHLRSFKEPIEEIKQATDKLEEATQLDAEKRIVQEVRIAEPVISRTMISDTTQTLVSTGIVVVLVLFFCLTAMSF